MIARLALVLAALLTGAAQAADEAPAAPYELARTLQTLQAQMAGGNAAAVAAQRGLLGAMEKAFLAADPSVWTDARNARAVVTFTMSGGSPRVLQTLIAGKVALGVPTELAAGALAYLENREDEAKKLLLPFDARALPPTLAGQVALVQAGLIAREDLTRAISLLDSARLLMPGTLVEEAALRREVFLVAQTGNLDRFEFLSRQYLRRFGTSIYAEDFRQRFATAVARLSLDDGAGRFPRLEAILKTSDPENQRALFLQMAQAAVVHGRIATASSAAKDALALAPIGSGDFMRAQLYEAAAGVAGDDIAKTTAQLRAVNRRQLNRRDGDLLAAAVAVADEVGAQPDAPVLLDPVAAVAADPARGEGWVSKTMQTAEAGLAAADALLDEATP